MDISELNSNLYLIYEASSGYHLPCEAELAMSGALDIKNGCKENPVVSQNASSSSVQDPLIPG